MQKYLTIRIYNNLKIILFIFSLNYKKKIQL